MQRQSGATNAAAEVRLALFPQECGISADILADETLRGHMQIVFVAELSRCAIIGESWCASMAA